MKCPIDQSTLEITTRHDIEIDYCPECRGVWLDRGELDKIIERSEQNVAQNKPNRDYERRKDSHRGDAHHGHSDGHYKKKKRESFMGDLFDF